MPFRDVIGHRRLTGLLAHSVASHSLPPSLIFSGPAGVGKRLSATALAQALNCLDLRPYAAPMGPGHRSRVAERRGAAPVRLTTIDEGVDACGVCSACTRIARGVHPDVLVLEPGENGSIRIEQVREVIDRSGYRPFEGRRRVVIIDEADALVVQAQNALLKTLEEPPPSSVFVLVTARPDVLLPTVRSRCPQVRFRPLGGDELASVLVARGESPANAHAVAAIADGSVGRALEVHAEDSVEARDIAQRVLSETASANDPRRRIEAAKHLLEGTGRGSTPAGDRERVASHLHAMASLLRDVELLAVTAKEETGTVGKQVRLANPDLASTLDRLRSAYAGDRGIRAFSAVDRALVALAGNASPKIVADWLVLEL